MDADETHLSENQKDVNTTSMSCLYSKLNYVYTIRQYDRYLDYIEELRRIIFNAGKRNNGHNLEHDGNGDHQSGAQLFVNESELTTNQYNEENFSFGDNLTFGGKNDGSNDGMRNENDKRSSKVTSYFSISQLGEIVLSDNIDFRATSSFSDTDVFSFDIQNGEQKKVETRIADNVRNAILRENDDTFSTRTVDDNLEVGANYVKESKCDTSSEDSISSINFEKVQCFVHETETLPRRSEQAFCSKHHNEAKDTETEDDIVNKHDLIENVGQMSTEECTVSGDLQLEREQSRWCERQMNTVQIVEHIQNSENSETPVVSSHTDYNDDNQLDQYAFDATAQNAAQLDFQIAKTGSIEFDEHEAQFDKVIQVPAITVTEIREYPILKTDLVQCISIEQEHIVDNQDAETEDDKKQSVNEDVLSEDGEQISTDQSGNIEKEDMQSESCEQNEEVEIQVIMDQLVEQTAEDFGVPSVSSHVDCENENTERKQLHQDTAKGDSTDIVSRISVEQDQIVGNYYEEAQFSVSINQNAEAENEKEFVNEHDLNENGERMSTDVFDETKSSESSQQNEEAQLQIIMDQLAECVQISENARMSSISCPSDCDNEYVDSKQHHQTLPDTSVHNSAQNMTDNLDTEKHDKEIVQIPETPLSPTVTEIHDCSSTHMEADLVLSISREQEQTLVQAADPEDDKKEVDNTSSKELLSESYEHNEEAKLQVIEDPLVENVQIADNVSHVPGIPSSLTITEIDEYTSTHLEPSPSVSVEKQQAVEVRDAEADDDKKEFITDDDLENSGEQISTDALGNANYTSDELEYESGKQNGEAELQTVSTNKESVPVSSHTEDEGQEFEDSSIAISIDVLDRSQETYLTEIEPTSTIIVETIVSDQNSTDIEKDSEVLRDESIVKQENEIILDRQPNFDSLNEMNDGGEHDNVAVRSSSPGFNSQSEHQNQQSSEVKTDIPFKSKTTTFDGNDDSLDFTETIESHLSDLTEDVLQEDTDKKLEEIPTIDQVSECDHEANFSSKDEFPFKTEISVVYNKHTFKIEKTIPTDHEQNEDGEVRSSSPEFNSESEHQNQQSSVVKTDTPFEIETTTFDGNDDSVGSTEKIENQSSGSSSDVLQEDTDKKIEEIPTIDQVSDCEHEANFSAQDEFPFNTEISVVYNKHTFKIEKTIPAVGELSHTSEEEETNEMKIVETNVREQKNTGIEAEFKNSESLKDERIDVLNHQEDNDNVEERSSSAGCYNPSEHQDCQPQELNVDSLEPTSPSKSETSPVDGNDASLDLTKTIESHKSDPTADVLQEDTDNKLEEIPTIDQISNCEHEANFSSQDEFPFKTEISVAYNKHTFKIEKAIPTDQEQNEDGEVRSSNPGFNSESEHQNQQSSEIKTDIPFKDETPTVDGNNDSVDSTEIIENQNSGSSSDVLQEVTDKKIEEMPTIDHVSDCEHEANFFSQDEFPFKTEISVVYNKHTFKIEKTIPTDQEQNEDGEVRSSSPGFNSQSEHQNQQSSEVKNDIPFKSETTTFDGNDDSADTTEKIENHNSGSSSDVLQDDTDKKVKEIPTIDQVSDCEHEANFFSQDEFPFKTEISVVYNKHTFKIEKTIPSDQEQNEDGEIRSSSPGFNSQSEHQNQKSSEVKTDIPFKSETTTFDGNDDSADSTEIIENHDSGPSSEVLQEDPDEKIEEIPNIDQISDCEHEASFISQDESSFKTKIFVVYNKQTFKIKKTIPAVGELSQSSIEEGHHAIQILVEELLTEHDADDSEIPSIRPEDVLRVDRETQSDFLEKKTAATQTEVFQENALQNEEHLSNVLESVDASINYVEVLRVESEIEEADHNSSESRDSGFHKGFSTNDVNVESLVPNEQDPEVYEASHSTVTFETEKVSSSVAQTSVFDDNVNNCDKDAKTPNVDVATQNEQQELADKLEAKIEDPSQQQTGCAPSNVMERSLIANIVNEDNDEQNIACGPESDVSEITRCSDKEIRESSSDDDETSCAMKAEENYIGDDNADFDPEDELPVETDFQQELNNESVPTQNAISNPPDANAVSEVTNCDTIEVQNHEESPYGVAQDQAISDQTEGENHETTTALETESSKVVSDNISKSNPSLNQTQTPQDDASKPVDTVTIFELTDDDSLEAKKQESRLGDDHQVQSIKHQPAGEDLETSSTDHETVSERIDEDNSLHNSATNHPDVNSVRKITNLDSNASHNKNLEGDTQVEPIPHPLVSELPATSLEILVTDFVAENDSETSSLNDFDKDNDEDESIDSILTESGNQDNVTGDTVKVEASTVVEDTAIRKASPTGFLTDSESNVFGDNVVNNGINEVSENGEQQKVENSHLFPEFYDQLGTENDEAQPRDEFLESETELNGSGSFPKTECFSLPPQMETEIEEMINGIIDDVLFGMTKKGSMEDSSVDVNNVEDNSAEAIDEVKTIEEPGDFSEIEQHVEQVIVGEITSVPVDEQTLVSGISETQNADNESEVLISKNKERITKEFDNESKSFAAVLTTCDDKNNIIFDEKYYDAEKVEQENRHLNLIEQPLAEPSTTIAESGQMSSIVEDFDDSTKPQLLHDSNIVADGVSDVTSSAKEIERSQVTSPQNEPRKLLKNPEHSQNDSIVEQIANDDPTVLKTDVNDSSCKVQEITVQVQNSSEVEPSSSPVFRNTDIDDEFWDRVLKDRTGSLETIGEETETEDAEEIRTDVAYTSSEDRNECTSLESIVNRNMDPVENSLPVETSAIDEKICFGHELQRIDAPDPQLSLEAPVSINDGNEKSEEDGRTEIDYENLEERVENVPSVVITQEEEASKNDPVNILEERIVVKEGVQLKEEEVSSTEPKVILQMSETLKQLSDFTSNSENNHDDEGSIIQKQEMEENVESTVTVDVNLKNKNMSQENDVESSSGISQNGLRSIVHILSVPCIQSSATFVSETLPDNTINSPTSSITSIASIHESSKASDYWLSDVPEPSNSLETQSKTFSIAEEVSHVLQTACISAMTLATSPTTSNSNPAPMDGNIEDVSEYFNDHSNQKPN